MTHPVSELLDRMSPRKCLHCRCQGSAGGGVKAIFSRRVIELGEEHREPTAARQQIRTQYIHYAQPRAGMIDQPQPCQLPLVITNRLREKRIAKFNCVL